MTDKLTKQEALEQISKLISKAQEAISEAEAIADKYHVSVYMDLGGYGMGGTYIDGDWESSSDSC